MTRKIVTLLTDFGTLDGYVGSIKGVLKSHYPNADVVDISHEVEPFDIRGAAFSLHSYYSFFPKGTIHIVVVDPGVGSSRRPLLVRTAQHYFIGPDNGVFKFIFNREAYTAYQLDPKKLTTVAQVLPFMEEIFSRLLPVSLCKVKAVKRLEHGWMKEQKYQMYFTKNRAMDTLPWKRLI